MVPNGIDLETFYPEKTPSEVREALGIPPQTRVIGTIGRLVPMKGHPYLLEAFAKLRHRSPNLWLLLVGDGPECGLLKSKAEELGIAGQIRFAGHRTDIPDLLATMEIFILPSIAEEFGRVLLEAMVMERPIVATGAGGVPEVVEEQVTGLLVPPADPAALAEAVWTLLVNPGRAKTMGRAGRQRVEKHFTMSRHVQLIEAVYQGTLGVTSH